MCWNCSRCYFDLLAGRSWALYLKSCCQTAVRFHFISVWALKLPTHGARDCIIISFYALETRNLYPSPYFLRSTRSTQSWPDRHRITRCCIWARISSVFAAMTRPSPESHKNNGYGNERLLVQKKPGISASRLNAGAERTLSTGCLLATGTGFADDRFHCVE